MTEPIMKRIDSRIIDHADGSFVDNKMHQEALVHDINN